MRPDDETDPGHAVADGGVLPVAVPPSAGMRAALRQAGAVAWRSVLRLRSNPEEIAGFALQPVIFVMLFVFVLGWAMEDDWRTYRDFALPGIAVQSVVFTTLGSGLTLNTDLRNGIHERFRTLPIARSAPLLGGILGDLVRYALSLLMMAVIGLLIGFRPAAGAVGVLAAGAICLGFAFALCWLWVLIGLRARSAMGVQTLSTVLMFPLVFGSSTLTSTDRLPGWLAAWAENNPVTWVTDTVRALLAGQPAGHPLTMTALWSAALVTVFLPLALRTYRRRV